MISTLVLSSLLTLSVGINGEGYFRLEAGNEVVYARSLALSVQSGLLADSEGRIVTPPVRIPNAATGLGISSTGEVTAKTGTEEIVVSQLVLAKFAPGAVLKRDGNVYRTSAKPTLGTAGEGGFGTISVAQITEASPTGGVGRIVVTINAVSEIFGPTLRVGDVAMVSGESAVAEKARGAVIGPSPLVGSDRAISKVTIQSALRTAGIPLDIVVIEVPEKAIARRASQMLVGSQVIAFARDWLSTTVGQQSWGSSTQVTDRRIVAGEVEFRAVRHSVASDSHIVQVEVWVGAERQAIQQVVFKAGAAPSTQVEGQPPVSVRSGQIVKVRLISNDVVCEVYGKTRSAAKVGELVSVYIEDSKSVLTGVLAVDGSVEVKL